MTKGVIIQASSRSNGNTAKMVNYLQQISGFDCVDLNRKNISHFDYEFKNSNDDFMPLIKSLVAKYETLVFATPIYWYTMSGILKVFFDRITDLLLLNKTPLRQLKGKRMAILSCGNDKKVAEGFLMPFIKTSEYLQMTFLGHIHTYIKNDTIPQPIKKDIKKFVDKLKTE